MTRRASETHTLCGCETHRPIRAVWEGLGRARKSPLTCYDPGPPRVRRAGPADPVELAPTHVAEAPSRPDPPAARSGRHPSEPHAVDPTTLRIPLAAALRHPGNVAPGHAGRSRSPAWATARPKCRPPPRSTSTSRSNGSPRASSSGARSTPPGRGLQPLPRAGRRRRRGPRRRALRDRPARGRDLPARATTSSTSSRWCATRCCSSCPLVPLCRADCRGLCPTCGVDHNVATCDCATDEPDPRWAALRSLEI